MIAVPLAISHAERMRTYLLVVSYGGQKQFIAEEYRLPNVDVKSAVSSA